MKDYTYIMNNVVSTDSIATREKDNYAHTNVFDQLDISESTNHDYKAHFGYFREFIENQGLLTPSSFLSYKQYLEKRPDISASTKNKYLVSARIYLRELAKTGKIPDITANVKSFKQDKKHKRTGLSESQIKSVWEKINSELENPKTARLKAIISLLIFQGLRQIEIVRLNVIDVNLGASTAMILGKGRDDKESIDLHPETVRAIRKYLEVSKMADGPMFTCLSNCHLNQRLSTRSLRDMVTSYLSQLEINNTTHGFRHYFTTALIKQFKGDLLEVAQYTRHRSLEMLQIYNDRVKKEADLPKFYQAFNSVLSKI